MPFLHFSLSQCLFSVTVTDSIFKHLLFTAVPPLLCVSYVMTTSEQRPINISFIVVGVVADLCLVKHVDVNCTFSKCHIESFIYGQIHVKSESINEHIL